VAPSDNNDNKKQTFKKFKGATTGAKKLVKELVLQLKVRVL
jgi:hypothetical protein